MLLGRKYQLTEKGLKELKEIGINDEMVNALIPYTNEEFPSRGKFIKLLREISPHPLSKKLMKLILRYSRPSPLGLERLIPNRNVREWTEAIFFAVIVTIILRVTLIAPFEIPSGSMYPTIKTGDRIFATMYNYGISIPYTEIKLFPASVNRGDIVIFPYPLKPEIDYIKRVVGLAGESVEVKGLKVYINGKRLKEPYAFHDPQTLAMLKNAERDTEVVQNFGPVRVPEGHFFVMGDNRFNSSDSRVWGFVKANTVRGKGQIVYWSHDPEAGLFSGYRLGRVGSLLK